MRLRKWPEVAVGPLQLIDGGPIQVVEAFRYLVDQVPDEPALRVTAEAHVAALLHLADPAYVDAFNASLLRYADGNAMVLLARLGGAREIRRAVTTDVAWDFLRVFQEQRGEIPRVALVGGPPGLAEAAGEVLVNSGVAKLATTSHGFHEQWREPVACLASSQPDLVFVGMGTPTETLWSQEHAASLGDALLVTCGGWFGYLVGQERRAPRVARALGLEWAFRVSQSPSRLGPRYLHGARQIIGLAAHQHRSRVASRQRQEGAGMGA